jgi:putative FmdB family regulatory protein
MPIYEYYCPHCDGHFRHLARTMDASPPPCPACGTEDVEKMISVAHRGRSEADRRERFDAKARGARDAGVDQQTAAQVLQEGGSLTDEVTPLGMERDAFREIVERRAAGATDEELADVVDAMPLPEPPDHLHHHHDHASGAHHDPHEDHAEASPSSKGRSRRRSKDLGWG